MTTWNFLQLLRSQTVDQLEILVGTNDLESGGVKYKIAQAIKHEKYGTNGFSYDIGVLEVRKEIEFNEKVQPIKYSAEEVPAGAIAQLTGWGYTSVSKFIINSA